jgi:hypothetical protein
LFSQKEGKTAASILNIDSNSFYMYNQSYNHLVRWMVSAWLILADADLL